MRRLLWMVILAALSVPAVAAALARGSDDGTLAIGNGQGTVSVSLTRGAVIGHVDRGTVIVKDVSAGDGASPLFTGCEPVQPTELKSVCRGTDLRFRVTGSRYTVKIVRSSGIDISAVGLGWATLAGNGIWLEGSTVQSDGVYSVNGAPFVSLPDTVAKRVLIGGTTGDD